MPPLECGSDMPITPATNFKNISDHLIFKCKIELNRWQAL